MERKRKEGWQQFLQNKIEMLAAYEYAKAISSGKPVKEVDRGLYAEAAFRSWLEGFLPARFGVTSGFILTQGNLKDDTLRHFDVIIYDKIECPILWTEKNLDKSNQGQSRAIPVEYVRGVLEIKSAFNRKSVNDAFKKLRELDPFLEGVDDPDEMYKKYLPASFFSAVVFFEIKKEEEFSGALLKEFAVHPRFYGGVILSAEGKSKNDTAQIRTLVGEKISGMQKLSMISGGAVTSDSIKIDGEYYSAMITWSDADFARFAFDLLALAQGKFSGRKISSFHGLGFGRT